jgi:hypothetical protein
MSTQKLPEWFRAPSLKDVGGATARRRRGRHHRAAEPENGTGDDQMNALSGASVAPEARLAAEMVVVAIRANMAVWLVQPLL